MPYTSFMLLERQKGENLRFHGNKCKQCDWVFFPKSRVCPECGAKDDFEDVISFTERSLKELWALPGPFNFSAEEMDRRLRTRPNRIEIITLGTRIH